MADVSEELIQQAHDAIHGIVNIESVTVKELHRPRVKVIFEIIHRISQTTGFPDPADVIENELPKELKQERIDYIQKIIDATSRQLNVDIQCQAKNITAGKEVTSTLIFLMKLCEAGRLKTASSAGAAEPQIEQHMEPSPLPAPEPEPERAQEPVQQPEIEPQQPENNIFGDTAQPPAPDSLFGDTKQPMPAGDELFGGVAEATAEPIQLQQVYTEQAPHYNDVLEQQRRQEEELREYERRRIEQENEEQLRQQRTQEALNNALQPSDKATFGRPPPSQQRRREMSQMNIQTTETGYRVKIEREDDDDDDEDEGQVQSNQNIAEQLGLDNDQQLAGLFDPVGNVDEAGDQKGAFMNDIENVQNEFNQGVPMSQQEKRQAAQQRVSNQANSKLITTVQDAVKGVIPFSKATSFLEEHLVRMRQELMQAIDDCQVQNQVRQKNINMENKARSLQDAKLRSVQEQIISAKQALCEIADQVIV